MLPRDIFTSSSLPDRDKTMVERNKHLIESDFFLNYLERFITEGGSPQEVMTVVRVLSMFYKEDRPPTVPVFYKDVGKLYPNSILERRQYIYTRLVQHFARPNPEAICCTDVQLAYFMYNEIFFDSKLYYTINFRISTKMSSSAGVFRCKYSSDGVPFNLKISISNKIVLTSFEGKNMTMGGIVATDRVTALQLILEHELTHMLMLTSEDYIKFSGTKKFKKHGEYFLQILQAFFNHTSCKHSVIDHSVEKALTVDEVVKFKYKGNSLEGKVVKVNKKSVVVQSGEKQYRVNNSTLN